MRLGWGPPENDVSSPHELDQDQSSDRGHVSPERPERRRCAAVTCSKADLSAFPQRGLRWVFERKNHERFTESPQKGKISTPNT